MLTFDEVLHEYRWNGERVPNVTSVIGHLTDYSRIPAEALERARQEGQAVHKMVDAACKGTLVDLPAWMYGHFDAWMRFVADTGFECIHSEHRVYHHSQRYAGTLDLAGTLPRLKTSKKPAVIDVKRSFYGGPAIGLQTAGYKDAWNSDKGRPTKLHERYALRLDADGKYRLKRFDDDPNHIEDSLAFLACLQQYRWRAKHYPKE